MTTTGWLKREIYSLTLLEVRSPKSRCQQDHASSEILVRTLPCLFTASGGGLQSLALLSSQLHHYMAFSPSISASVSKFSPSEKDTDLIGLRVYPIPV